MSYAELLSDLRAAGNFRSIPTQDAGDLVDLSTNDYLGLAADPELQAEFFSDSHNQRIPMTSSASRLLASVQEEYYKLEKCLADLYHRQALILNSGYHANTGLIPALCEGKTLIVADKLVHASMIDGIKLSRAPFERFRHNDMKHLRRLIEKHYQEYDRLLILVESVYSMDGDSPDLAELAALKREFPKTLLYVDEAHAVGVEGEKGLGLAHNYPEVDVIIGTFGKALASQGAFALMSTEIKDLVINCARSFIFSTAIPPITAAYNRFIINKMVQMDNRRAKLKGLETLVAKPLNIQPSHILPLLVGDPIKAVNLSKKLREEGFKVLAIRTPTVPPGTDRLRISLSAALDEGKVEEFASIITKICNSDS